MYLFSYVLSQIRWMSSAEKITFQKKVVYVKCIVQLKVTNVIIIRSSLKKECIFRANLRIYIQSLITKWSIHSGDVLL